MTLNSQNSLLTPIKEIALVPVEKLIILKSCFTSAYVLAGAVLASSDALQPNAKVETHKNSNMCLKDFMAFLFKNNKKKEF
jgi:hypothetical protein